MVPCRRYAFARVFIAFANIDKDRAVPHQGGGVIR
jgi:hypothetical protein